MPRIKTTTIPEQIATHLREGIASGRWMGVLPGRALLAEELGVSSRSVQKATTLLTKEGLLVSEGQGKRMRVCLPDTGMEANPIRVGILCFNQADQGDQYFIELRHQLEEAGHIAVVPQQGLQELGMKVSRVARVVNATQADAWMVMSGSREVLQWFADQGIKVFAFAGRRFELPIAGTGPDKAGCYTQVVEHLVGLGHKRIVLLCRHHLRKPMPSLATRAFLEAMVNAGLPTGDYNLPEWDESPEGLETILDSLFKTTPPTAMMVDEPHVFHAAHHYLAQRQLRVPQDVSVVCTDGSPGFAWCRPSVAHIRWDYQPVVRRIMKWVGNVARGVEDTRQGFTKAHYVEGGTVGPPLDR